MIDEVTLENVQETIETTPEQEIAPRDDLADLAEIKELNFRQMRENAERDRYRAQQAEQRLQELELLMKQKSEPDDLDSDDIADKRALKKLRDEQRRENERRDKQAADMEEQMKKLYQSSVQNEVYAMFPDYKNIVTEKNVAQLAQKEPEIFESLKDTKDLRSRLVAIYKNVKTHVNTKSYDALDAKIAENKTKPRSAATVPVQESSSPLAGFREDGRWKLTPEEAKALRADTARCARNR